MKYVILLYEFRREFRECSSIENIETVGPSQALQQPESSLVKKMQKWNLTYIVNEYAVYSFLEFNVMMEIPCMWVYR